MRVVEQNSRVVAFIAACLLLSILFAQTLGVLHRQLHTPGALTKVLSHHLAQQVSHPHVSVDAGQALQETDDALGLVHDSSVCSLLDHLLLGSTLISNPLEVPVTHAVPLLLSQCPVPSPKSDPRLAFLARGPPTVNL
jgi:hypothetical protein